MTICAYCKSRVFPTDRKCSACGSRVFVDLQEAPQRAQTPPEPTVVYQTIHHTVYARPRTSERNRWVALLLCLLGGAVGLHRFYVGKIGTGIVYLLTGGVFFLGALVDFFSIAAGSFRDSEGLPLR